MCLSIESSAQKDADQEYNKGIELQKTKTISNQNKAIKRFEAAKVLYTTDANKKKCDSQIEKCRKTIKALKPKPDIRNNTDDKSSDNHTNSSSKNGSAQLSLSEEQLEFKGDPKEQKSVRIICSGDNWSIESKPEWVGIYKGVTKDRISVEAEKNTTGNSRSGIVVIKYKDKKVNLIIYQKKLGFFKKLVDDIDKKVKKK